MKNSMFSNFEYNNQMIEVDGIKMSMSQYKAYKAKKTKENKIKERNSKIIPHLPEFINNSLKSIKLLKTIHSYYRNAYRQWGIVGKEVIEHPCLNHYFVMYVAKYNDIVKNINTIVKIGKSNDKDIYQYIEKLAYNVDDLKNIIDKLSDGIIESQLLINLSLKDKEVINGCGRRLGLQTICSRVFDCTVKLTDTIKKFDSIVNGGTDVMEYDPNTKKTICFTSAHV